MKGDTEAGLGRQEGIGIGRLQETENTIVIINVIEITITNNLTTADDDN